MTYPPEAWRRLARAVKDRRRDLGHTQVTLSAAGGPSATIISRIEGAKQSAYEPRVLSLLERALCWSPGSVTAILDGGRASPAEPPPPVACEADYPPYVGADRLLRAIWDAEGAEVERRMAILAVLGHRRIQQAGGVGRDRPNGT